MPPLGPLRMSETTQFVFEQELCWGTGLVGVRALEEARGEGEGWCCPEMKARPSEGLPGVGLSHQSRGPCCPDPSAFPRVPAG